MYIYIYVYIHIFMWQFVPRECSSLTKCLQSKICEKIYLFIHS